MNLINKILWKNRHVKNLYISVYCQLWNCVIDGAIVPFTININEKRISMKREKKTKKINNPKHT